MLPKGMKRYDALMIIVGGLKPLKLRSNDFQGIILVNSSARIESKI